MISYGPPNEWYHTLFVKHPQLYLPELKNLNRNTESEITSIIRIFKEFGIDRGSKILDFSCGIGRHSVALARKGYQVVGYDPSPYFVKYAKGNAKAAKINELPEFICGPPYEIERSPLHKMSQAFDAIIILSNSIGYSNSERDFHILCQLSNYSKSDGLLITESEHRDWRIRNFIPYLYYDYGKIQLYENWEFDLERSTAVSISKFFRKSKNGTLSLALQLPVTLRLYSLHEIKRLLAASNWTYLKSYGNIKTLEKLSTDTADIVTVSKRAK